MLAACAGADLQALAAMGRRQIVQHMLVHDAAGIQRPVVLPRQPQCSCMRPRRPLQERQINRIVDMPHVVDVFRQHRIFDHVWRRNIPFRRPIIRSPAGFCRHHDRVSDPGGSACLLKLYLIYINADPHL